VNSRETVKSRNGLFINTPQRNNTQEIAQGSIFLTESGWRRLTGAVTASFDKVNGTFVFAAEGGIWSNRNGCDYFQQRTTIQFTHRVKFLPTNVVMLIDQKQYEEINW